MTLSDFDYLAQRQGAEVVELEFALLLERGVSAGGTMTMTPSVGVGSLVLEQTGNDVFMAASIDNLTEQPGTWTLSLPTRPRPRYMPKRPPRPGAQQTWSTFLANHRHELLAIDFAVVPTITFEVLYVFFVISIERREILHFNVTKHPTARWTAQQVVEACPFELPGHFRIRDDDSIYGAEFVRRVDSLGLEQVMIAPRSPWQNCFAERWISSLRRDCLDHVIALNERQLSRVIRDYVDYYHRDRTHLGLEKDAPIGRAEEGPELGKVVALPRVGGLHHRYTRDRRSAA